MIAAAVRALAAAELVAVVLLAVAVAARRWMAGLAEARQDWRLAPHEEAVLELLCADGDGREPVDPLQAPGGRAAAARLLAGYAGSVKGTARARLTAFFERAGYVDAAIAELGRWSEWRRGRAARTLGDIGSPQAVAALCAAADADPGPRVRAAAVRALGRIGGGEAADGVLHAWLAGRVPSGIAAQALLDIGAPAAPALLAAAADGGPGVRATACRALAHAGVDGRPDVVLHLATVAIEDADAPVRAAACTALAAAGSDDAAFALASAMDDADPAVRAAACDAAAGLGIPDLQEIAAGLARDPDPQVARAAARAMAAVRPAAAAALPFGREALAERAWRAA